MKIAVEGCAHGELEKIYETIKRIEAIEGLKVDLLLCCGDFQAARNMEDLQTMAVSKKYQNMGSFYKYYSGELQAPILTIFIGGNHEASNYMQELPYGGWAAPNIFYLGYAGVVRINGIRIGGLSGIYKGHDYLKGRYEYSPYTESTKRSVYHMRQLEVFRLKQLSGKIDIFMSHDWPRGIYNFGNKVQLARFKPFLRDEMIGGKLGSPPCETLLLKLQPLYWFAAHLHCKFAALVPHEHEQSQAPPPSNEYNKSPTTKETTEEHENFTKFLALDKCLPKRRFLQILDIEGTDDNQQLHLEYDLEWLTILYLTNHLINVKQSKYYLPNEKCNTDERFNFTPTADEMAEVRNKFNNDLRIPENFECTVKSYEPIYELKNFNYNQPKSQINPQCVQFCNILGIDDPLTLSMLISGNELVYSDNKCNQIKDPILNTSSTFIVNDSVISASSPLKRRNELNLPTPSAIGNSLQQSNELILPSSSDSDNIEEDVAEPVKEIKVCPESLHHRSIGLSVPLSKKFKGRNQEVYQSRDVEIDDSPLITM